MRTRGGLRGAILTPRTQNITEGPHAGTTYFGNLLAVTNDAGTELGGAYLPEGQDEIVDVLGTIADGTIDLRLTFADGSEISGVGPHSTAAWECIDTDAITGTASGPEVGDIGDWALTAKQMAACKVSPSSAACVGSGTTTSSADQARDACKLRCYYAYGTGNDAYEQCVAVCFNPTGSI